MASSGFARPQPNVPFRLYCPSTKSYLYTNKDLNHRVHTSQGTSDNQWFTIEVDSEGNEQVYIRSKSTNECISLGTSPGGGNLIFTGQMQNADQKILIEQGTGSRAGQFRWFGPLSKLYAVGTNDKIPGVYKQAAAESDYAWWSFVYRDPTFVSLTYKPGQGQILDSTPSQLNSQTFEASNNAAQYPFATNILSPNTATWKLPGQVFPLELSGDMGVPGVSRGQIVIRKRPDLKFKFEEPIQYFIGWSENFTLNVPADTRAQATAWVIQSTLQVPFVARFRSADPGSTTEWDVSGTWSGTTTHSYTLKTEYSRL